MSGVCKGQGSERGLHRQRAQPGHLQALKDKTERNYLNELPTSFVLPAEAVDRLRAAALTIILDSPDFQQMLNDVGGRVVVRPAITSSAAPTVPTLPVAQPAAQ